VTLQVGTTGDVIEVTENVAQVDTLTATLGSVETQRRILDLPLVERDTFQLGLLQTGVLRPTQMTVPAIHFQSAGNAQSH